MRRPVPCLAIATSHGLLFVIRWCLAFSDSHPYSMSVSSIIFRLTDLHMPTTPRSFQDGQKAVALGKMVSKACGHLTKKRIMPIDVLLRSCSTLSPQPYAVHLNATRRRHDALCLSLLKRPRCTVAPFLMLLIPQVRFS